MVISKCKSRFVSRLICIGPERQGLQVGTSDESTLVISTESGVLFELGLQVVTSNRLMKSMFSRVVGSADCRTFLYFFTKFMNPN